jgi:hypothetical protein
MADNVIKFRKIEKKPEPKSSGGSGKDPQKQPDWPAWLPWAVLIAVAIGLTALQGSGLFGG